ncbi:efflux RND transporter permease subunit, partial [Deinococcus sp. 14RED07]|nr:efflux RND transporter permease subunit [Deinococcus sp. 14RED07]
MSTHDPEDFLSKPGATLPDGTPEPPIHPLVRFSVKNYVFSIGIFVMIVLAGLATTLRLGVELLPNFEVPILAVSTSYPGANPDQVDREVSRRVEDAVSTLAGVVDINTTSVSNQSAVIITFSDDTNIDSAANSVSQAVAAIRGILPDGSEAPVVQKFDPNATPILSLALLGGSNPPDEVTTYAEDVLVPRLE